MIFFLIIIYDFILWLLFIIIIYVITIIAPRTFKYFITQVLLLYYDYYYTYCDYTYHYNINTINIVKIIHILLILLTLIITIINIIHITNIFNIIITIINIVLVGWPWLDWMKSSTTDLSPFAALERDSVGRGGSTCWLHSNNQVSESIQNNNQFQSQVLRNRVALPGSQAPFIVIPQTTFTHGNIISTEIIKQ